MSSMNFVATSVFFAQMAYIENLGVRNVLLSDGSTIEGGMCHSDKNDAGGSLGLGDVRFWLGNANPALGKIRGYKDGKFVAADGKAVFDPSGNVTLCGGNAKFDKNGNTTIANLTATSGKFTGEVNATSGTFNGKVTATEGEFKGTLNADLFYSKVKSNAENGYHIDPEKEPYNTFYWEYSAVQDNHWIYLPDATKYEGIELCFMWTRGASQLIKYLYVSSIYNQLINIPNNYEDITINGISYAVQILNGYNITDTRFFCLSNQYVRVKAMNGQWFIISGSTTQE